MSPADAPAPRVEVAIAIVWHQGRLLIGQRPQDATLPGLWEFPGGKVEPGETPTAAAERECLEETGVLARVVGRYPVIEHDYDHAAVRLHFLACEWVGEKSPLPQRCRWIHPSELGSYAFPAANDALLEMLLRGQPPESL
ncbi:MAG: (deoxy)nucleoside triphosphate pyrophosphohydrolase [Planctomycetota bacterium]|nr:MAG: (deoxy)nucleoside triphosphate pyrophosphohydrolase [Planctomycetota bacterium]